MAKPTNEQVMEMVRALLGLTDLPRPDHAADALAVAICHANSSTMLDRVARERGGGCRAEEAGMIERLTGIVAAKGAEGVVVEVGGVGFLLEVSP